jgi:hypothetical protein
MNPRKLVSIDISAGLSTKTTYYDNLSALLKYTFGNVIIVTDLICQYTRHIPIKLKFNTGRTVYADNGKLFKNVCIRSIINKHEFECVRHGSHTYPGMRDCKNERLFGSSIINDEYFIYKYFNLPQINAENVLELFMNYNYKLMINHAYVFAKQKHAFYFQMNPEEAVFNNIFIVKITNEIYHCMDTISASDFSNPYNNINFTKNMFLIWNFSKDIYLPGYDVTCLPDQFTNIIEKYLPKFCEYNKNAENKLIKIKNRKMIIEYRCNKYTWSNYTSLDIRRIPIPIELNNIFINVDGLSIKGGVSKDSGYIHFWFKWKFY